MVQVAADRGGREPEQVAQFGGADGAVLQDGVQDAVPGALFGVDCRERGRSLRCHRFGCRGLH